MFSKFVDCGVIGLIVVGNSGAGKSIYCNILAGEEIFRHELSPESVTAEAEYKEIPIPDPDRAGVTLRARILNIPGLMEVDDESGTLLERNKRELNRSFQMCDSQVINTTTTRIYYI
jgi:hypothetical protein